MMKNLEHRDGQEIEIKVVVKLKREYYDQMVVAEMIIGNDTISKRSSIIDIDDIYLAFRDDLDGAKKEIKSRTLGEIANCVAACARSIPDYFGADND